MSDDLRERVQQFHRMELPGQPIGMHMGTFYLVDDLWKEIERLRALNAEMAGALEAFASADINDTARDNQAIDNACAVFITHGDLRTASRLVQKAKAEGSAE